ncbi:MAG: hypothetical protein CMF22_10520 [Idiomarinaceae bacterium]|nr:hypothetical protein [Idiomarinaceae bacterium]MBG23874.1 hypothetical protein [Idiomarinaceae bacterium]|tara:strand:- start:6534 stop:6788 length:255 start_codon:yes stop_codon:yes gene_type:complete
MLEFIYFGGIVIGALMICYQTYHAMGVLSSTKSFIFLLLEAVKDCVKLMVWPVSLTVCILQIPFGQAVVEDMTNALEDNYDEDS